jgi:DNA primase
VYPDGRFYCHGCKESGDAFDLVMACEGKSFPEALADLAQEAGIPLVKQSTYTDKEKSLWVLLQAAQEHFRKGLDLFHKDAESYLQSRGIKPETAKVFQLGFAPGRLDSLSRLEEKFSERALVEAGFLKQNPDGAHYPFFRNRLILPVLNRTGKATGFVGRDVTGSAKAKYLNWAGETFDRKSALFGLHTVPYDTEHVFVAEGPLDALVAYQELNQPSVAMLGSEATELQVSNVLKLAPKITFLIDGDQAGRSMAIEICRRIPRVIEKPVDVGFMFCPKGSDPGSYLLVDSIDQLERYQVEDVLLRTVRHRWDQTAWFGQSKTVEWLGKAFPRDRENAINRVLRFRLSKELDVPYDSLLSREEEA